MFKFCICILTFKQIMTLEKAVKNDQSFACNNKLVINIKKNMNYSYFIVSQQGFLRYPIADDFVYVVMKRHLCIEARLSALSAAKLTSNELIDRFGPWLPICYFHEIIPDGPRCV